MFSQRTVESIVNKVCNYGGVHELAPATKDDIRQIVTESIYQVLSSRDFVEYIDEELGKIASRKRTGYGAR